MRYMQYRDDLPDEVCKKLKSIERRQKKIIKEIEELGYSVYLHAGGLSIMDGDTHSDDWCHTPLYENQVWTIDARKWSGGDW